MRRRSALASLAAAGLSTLAGCSTVGTTRLTDPTVESRHDEETVLRFTDDSGSPVATVAIDYRLVQVEELNQYVRLRLSIINGENTRIKSLRYRFYRAGDEVFSDMYTRDFPASFRFFRPTKPRAPDGYVFELSETGIHGDGTISNRFQAWVPGDPDTATVGVAVSAAVDRTTLLGGSFELDATTEVTAEPL